MFIPGMPSPLHLRQLANVIYQAVMDDSRVSAVHLTRLDRHTLFLWVCSGFLPLFWGWSYYPKEEVDVIQTYVYLYL